MPLMIKLNATTPRITIHELALMLEIDLVVMNDRKSFERRLGKAIKNAYQQGLNTKPPTYQ